MSILNDFLSGCQAPKFQRTRTPRPTLETFLDGHAISAHGALRRHAEHHARTSGRVVPFNFSPQRHSRGDRRAA
jgi:hypothetical protein